MNAQERRRAARWILMCAAGSALGLPAAQAAAELVRVPLSAAAGGLPTLALYGGVLGAFAGAAQWLALQPRMPAARWIGAAAFGLACGFVPASFAAAAFAPLAGRLGLLILAGPITTVAFGAVAGAACSLAQLPLLPALRVSRGAWLLCGVAGLAGGCLLAAGSAELLVPRTPAPLPALVSGACAGACWAAAQWIALRAAPAED